MCWHTPAPPFPDDPPILPLSTAHSWFSNGSRTRWMAVLLCRSVSYCMVCSQAMSSLQFPLFSKSRVRAGHGAGHVSFRSAGEIHYPKATLRYEAHGESRSKRVTSICHVPTLLVTVAWTSFLNDFHRSVVLFTGSPFLRHAVRAKKTSKLCSLPLSLSEHQAIIST